MSLSEVPHPKRRATSLPEQEMSDSAQEVAANDVLLIEILRRLPINSLLKFRYVSKGWLSLKTDPFFCHHLSVLLLLAPVSGLFVQVEPYRRRNPKSFFVSLRGTSSDSHSFRSLGSVPDPLGPGMRIIQSCNGLFLCCTLGVSRDPKYHVYNPMTRQCTDLPPLPVKGGASKMLSVSIAFDPITSPHYKVICIRSSGNLQGFCQIAIYSSDKGPWRHTVHPRSCHVEVGPILLPLFPVDAIESGNGVFWNGAVHWISYNWERSIYFHIETECLKEMALPPVPEGWEDRRIRYFGESIGHLHLIYEAPTPQYYIYEMETVYSKWFVRYRLDDNALSTAFPEIMEGSLDPVCLVNILGLVRENFDGESFLVVNVRAKMYPKGSIVNTEESVQGRIVRYSLGSGTCEELCDITPRPQRDGTYIECLPRLAWSNTYQHVESLCCV